MKFKIEEPEVHLLVGNKMQKPEDHAIVSKYIKSRNKFKNHRKK